MKTAIGSAVILATLAAVGTMAVLRELVQLTLPIWVFVDAAGR